METIYFNLTLKCDNTFYFSISSKPSTDDDFTDEDLITIFKGDENSSFRVKGMLMRTVNEKLSTYEQCYECFKKIWENINQNCSELHIAPLPKQNDSELIKIIQNYMNE